MSCKSIMFCTLTIVIAASTAGLSFGQYQGYASSPQYDTQSPQRAQLPSWNLTRLPPLPSTQVAANDRYPAPHAYSPSETPSVNPFANMRSHQQQTPMSYSSMPSQPAARSYNTHSTSYGVQQQYAVGDGIPRPDPTQQVLPTPQPYSYYDQPAQTYTSQPDYGYDAKAAGCSTFGGLGVRTGWYGSGIGMIMGRDRANNLWLSYDLNDIRDRVLSSNDADFSSAGGAGATIGHYFNCGRNSVQLVYWGIYPGTSEANAYWADTVGGLDTILHFDQIDYDAGAGSLDLRTNYFRDAERHRLRRNYDVHNIELNLLGHNFTSGCGPMQLGWTAGVRYLRFDEDFLYSTAPYDVVFTGAAEEVHYEIDVENNLIGFQIGGQADYRVGSRLSLFANTKVGIYGNHISHRSRIYGANGLAFVADPANPYFPEDVDIASTKDAFSMIGDLSIGANWSISPCWTVNAGYRIVGVNGVALSTNQIPVDFISALDSIRAVDSNGCLILHGAFGGISYCY